MADFDKLLEEAHRRGIRIINDFVPNHTSEEHPWFVESRASRDNPKRDWFIWRDGRGAKPPNNWTAAPGGRAWRYDERTGQYFYHAFFDFQPI
jgi:alpha-glucosidase